MQSDEPPDIAESATTEERRAQVAFPVVGIGASAGGLEAFTALFQRLPGDTGMAFVLVQHLHPEHRSALAEILGRSTMMPVIEVSDEPVIAPNHVYVIPPGQHVVMDGARLKLVPRVSKGKQRSIDLFFRSLAESQGQRSIAIVLSGTASDGALGLEEVKAAGGVTFAQDASAQHDGMPRSAVATGCVDLVLPPEKIAFELVRLAQHPYVANGEPPSSLAADDPRSKSLDPILRSLRGATGVDFSDYKPATLHRRINRRILLRKVDGIEAYAELLKQNPSEVDALYNDILINVTSFFRDPEMFETLKSIVFPELVRDHDSDGSLRAWALGCSTGEEAYSLAIAYLEFQEAARIKVPLQILASDLNKQSVELARAGLYGKNIHHDVSPERLRRYFAELDGGYRVCKEVREMCVFSRHNVLADPPFSKLNLLLCRNLLIYLGRTLQQKLMPILHYALRPNGCLVLGNAETVGSSSPLFELRDARHKIYRRRPLAQNAAPLFNFRFSESTLAGAGGHVSEPLKPTLLEQADRVLLGRYVPAAILVNASFEVLQVRGDTSPYVALAPGRASLNLFKMLREELFGSAQIALEEAMRSGSQALERTILGTKSGPRAVEIEVVPVRDPLSQSAFLLLFREVGSASSAPAEAGSGPHLWSRMVRRFLPDRSAAAARAAEDASARGEVERLQGELAALRAYVQSILEQHEASAEELQSASEEAQSSNEELQSINEELETSKEEIQSSNEELSTVNDELATRNAELARTNDDLTNLFANVDVPILILGQDLRIRRFNQAAQSTLNLIPADMGRPIGHVKLNLVTDFEHLFEEVSRTLVTKEMEVQDRKGRWFLLRLRPYRTLENRIDGAVLALIDIDAMRRARAYAEAVVANVRFPLVVLDGKLRVRLVNRAFCEMFHASIEDSEGRLLYELGNGQWNIPELRRLLEEVLPAHRVFDDFRVVHEFEEIGSKTMLLSARRFNPEEEGEETILLSIEDATERERLELELHRRVQELAAEDQRKSEFLAVLSHELRNPLNAVRGWIEIIGRPGVSEQELRRGLEVIERNSKLQSDLIGELIDVHRLASGSVRMDFAEMDLNGVLEDVIASVLPSAEAKHVSIECELGSEATALRGDRNRLHQAFGNLLVNAVKFTPERGIVRVHLRRLGSRAEVRVSDTGVGIDAENLTRVFEPFRRLRSGTNLDTSGLGLGLAIAKRLFELHGGSIRAESLGTDRGATFSVSLPLLATEEITHAATFRMDPAHELPPALPGVRILLVDDERDARDLLGRILERSGARARAVASTDEALEFLEREPFDAIVSDIGMAGRDGYDLIRTVRAMNGDVGQTGAIALTAYASAEDRERARDAGFDAHLAKPIDAGKLIETIQRVTSRRPPRS